MGIQPSNTEIDVMRSPGSSLTFTLSESSALASSGPVPTTFGPRVGQITLTRFQADPADVGRSEPENLPTTIDNLTCHTEIATRSFPIKTITIDTPNIFVGTSRGVVPHLSRDHVNGSDAIQWINVPFESL
ncbi:hypothetical protein JVU11DRAFT_8041 [Chiua virens]|nr:hypothetical protein JVU11DRAFT_8041 [Chiua virens]